MENLIDTLNIQGDVFFDADRKIGEIKSFRITTFPARRRGEKKKKKGETISPFSLIDRNECKKQGGAADITLSREKKEGKRKGEEEETRAINSIPLFP